MLRTLTRAGCNAGQPALARVMSTFTTKAQPEAWVQQAREWVYDDREAAHAAHVAAIPPEARTHPDGTVNVPGTCVRKPGRLSIQETYEPQGMSFGNGPSNPHGLRLQSFRSGTPGGLESRWQAKEMFEGFPGLVAAGIIATLMECQGNWTAALKLMDVDGLRAPPLTTPASFHINYLRPIPSDEEVFIVSTCETPVECSEVVPNSQRVQVECTVSIRDPAPGAPASAHLVCATSTSQYIKIGPMRDLRSQFRKPQ
jgi:acyl-coenzyme A thioesterase PaaI-like protein